MSIQIQVTINGAKYVADASQTILQVCRENGIAVPTLCHHPRLKPIGACRICLVEVEPGNKLVPSCLTKVLNNMVIKTHSPRVIHARKVNLELLLARHTADCLVCDKGGECELQDACFKVEVSGRFTEGRNRLIDIFGLKPMDVNLDDTRSIIERDLNKCILCKRCVQVCNDVQGLGAINFSRRGMHTGMATFYGRELDCEFCGQCVDICPVGALVHKMSKYRARVWQLAKTNSVCSYCSVGCSLTLATKDNEVVKVTAAADAGVNKGNLCYKGRYGQVYVNDPDRLTKPLIKDKATGAMKESNWNTALNLVAKRLTDIKTKYGPDAIGGIGSVRCTNEANYLFQKLMRAGIGTNNVDNCARLEHASSISALKETLGWGAMSNSFGDLAQAKVLFMLGCNPLETHSVLGVMIRRLALQQGLQIILAEPRQVKLVKHAKMWLPVKPGTDLALVNGMLQVIIAEGLYNREFVEKNTQGFEEFKAQLKPYTLEYVAKETGIAPQQVVEAARLFAGAENACIMYGVGVTQHVNGTAAVYGLADLAMLTGNLGRPGSGIIPLRGQNNTQGACDMGVLPDYYPGYQPVNDAQVRQGFESAWGAKLPDKPGLAMTQMLGEEGNGLRAMYVMGENPAIAFPDQSHSRKRLGELDFLVVQDIFLNDTAKLADVVLPAASFAETWGTFTNNERRVQLVRQAIQPAGGAGGSLPDWLIVAGLSVRLGLAQTYAQPEQVFKEMARINPTYQGITYYRLQNGGIQWPCPAEDHPGTPDLYAGEGFSGGRFKFKYAQYTPVPERTSPEYPYMLLTGKRMLHYHTGAFSRMTEKLIQIPKQGVVEINPEDAAGLGITDGQTVKLASARGEIVLQARLSDSSPKGTLFVPVHFPEAEANVLFDIKLDAVSHTPELKMCPVSVQAV